MCTQDLNALTISGHVRSRAIVDSTVNLAVRGLLIGHPWCASTAAG
jgi:hypothetical protein